MAVWTIAGYATADIREQALDHWNRTLRCLLRGGQRADDEAAIVLLYWARLALDSGPEAVIEVATSIQGKVWPHLNRSADADSHSLMKYIDSYWPELLSGSLQETDTLVPSPVSVEAWERLLR